MTKILRNLCIFILLALVVLSLASFLYFVFSLYNQEAQIIPHEQGTISVYFCPQDNCEELLLRKMQTSTETIHCAFYDLDLPHVIATLQQKYAEGVAVSVVIDADNAAAINDLPFVRQDTRSAYMHNKFCIFDSTEIMTGSMNPTYTDIQKNRNNILFIKSRILSENYETEFRSLWNGEFGTDAPVQYPLLVLNNLTIENYFCPEDNCEEHIAEKLSQANDSIYFMQFSFTSDTLGNIILEKAETKKVEIAGIFDATQNSVYSEYEKLKLLNVSIEEETGKLHHKVFIIDESIVITGSMNPSKNGNEKNDENILIIHDPLIAALFIAEFQDLVSGI